MKKIELTRCSETSRLYISGDRTIYYANLIYDLPIFKNRLIITKLYQLK